MGVPKPRREGQIGGGGRIGQTSNRGASQSRGGNPYRGGGGSGSKPPNEGCGLFIILVLAGGALGAVTMHEAFKLISSIF